MGLVHLFNILDSWDDFDDYRKVSLVAVTCSFAEASTGSFSNDEGDGSEDVTFKMNWRFFFLTLSRQYSKLLEISNIGEFP